MAISTRNSVLAIKEETTEGTPIAPAAATDFVRMQDDLDVSLEKESLDNAELNGSLGPSKSISGIDTPSASFSHYLRHSGTEGQAPNFGPLLKAAFGAVDTNGTEHDTVAGSTTSVVSLDTGEGSSHPRGSALLIKDSTNGYSIRPVHSVSSDDLTLGFDLAAAPASGVNTGKAITYYPADSGHPSLTLWHFIGNQGGIEMFSGGRVVDLSITGAAGELLNANYSLEGVTNYYNPIIIESTDTYLDFTDDDSTYAVTVTAKTYQDPHELASALTTAMNASGTSETHSVTYSDSTGKFTIENTTGSTLSLLWSTGANTANTIGDKIGFTVSADDTGATTYTSDSAQDWSTSRFSLTPSYDDSDPLVAKDQLVMIGDSDDYACLKSASIDIDFSTPKQNILSICSTSGVDSSIINERNCEITVSGYVSQHDADRFRRQRLNSDTRVAYVFGTKSGDNWEAGKCGCIYAPTCTVSSVDVGSDNNIATLTVTLSTYVDSSGNGEFYISFV